MYVEYCMEIQLGISERRPRLSKKKNQSELQETSHRWNTEPYSNVEPEPEPESESESKPEPEARPEPESE